METLVKSTLIGHNYCCFIYFSPGYVGDGWVIRNSLLSKIIEHRFPNNYGF